MWNCFLDLDDQGDVICETSLLFLPPKYYCIIANNNVKCKINIDYYHYNVVCCIIVK